MRAPAALVLALAATVVPATAAGPAVNWHGGGWRLVGVDSRGTDWTCAAGPEVYTDATGYQRWIAATTGQR